LFDGIILALMVWACRNALGGRPLPTDEI